ncbi:Triadin [Collichthys lucidus]|uniref:Triadin n=1 Tax=Collichthys lucidus TaxID=240159 RepID=A0A4U5UM57_COLLU|nr:Triadin [Collichthys lucidus]
MVAFQHTFRTVRSSTTTTTMVIDAKNGDAGSPSARGSKKTFAENLHSTFSSPLAWILVLALVITWSCVFVIMFDLMDYKTISGGLTKIGSDPMKAVKDVAEESSNFFSVAFRFAANLVAPEEDEVTCPPATLEDEDEAEDEEPTAELKKTVDESEDRKEEDDEDDDGEKATVDVIKPVPEPEEETAKAEPAVCSCAPPAKAKETATKTAEKKVGPCRPAPVYCPSPPGWYVHHVVTDNPYPPTNMPEVPEPETPVQPEVQTPAAGAEPAVAPVQEPETVGEEVKAAPAKKEPAAKEKTKAAKKEPAAAKQKKKSEKTAVKSKAKASTPKKGKAEKAEKKSVKEAQEDSQTEDNTTEKKKTGQRYFQCIYIPGKHAQYPLRPFTPAMSPTVMSPALKSMLDQHRAARTSGQ